MKRVKILQIPLDPVTETEALELVEGYIDSGKPHQIATVNGEFILTAQDNSAFRRTLQSADLNIADSSGVTWAARFGGHPLPERIPGADLVPLLAKVGEEKGWSFYLVGAGPGIAEAAAATLKQRHPTLKITRAEEGITPSSGPDEVQALVKRISQAKPDILLVAFGAPKQDLFIAENKEALGVPVMIGVGGTFDFLAGRIKRAPRLFRWLGIEFLWRLLMEPKRWRRIINATIVFPLKVITHK